MSAAHSLVALWRPGSGLAQDRVGHQEGASLPRFGRGEDREQGTHRCALHGELQGGADAVPRVVAVVAGDRVGPGWSGHRPRDVGVHLGVVLSGAQRVDDPGPVSGCEPGPGGQRQLGAGEPLHAGHAHPSAQLGLDLAEHAVDHPGASLEAAAGLLGLLAEPPLRDDDGHERLGAHAGPGEGLLQLVVDLTHARRPIRAAVTRQPLVPFRTVLGDGADQEQDLVDQLGLRRHVEQFAQASALASPVLELLEPDAGVHEGRGHGPCPRAVVLDDRDAREGYPVRWAVVNLDGMERAGQVYLVEGVGLPPSGLGPEPGPPGESARGEGQRGRHPAERGPAPDGGHGDQGDRRPERQEQPGGDPRPGLNGPEHRHR